MFWFLQKLIAITGFPGITLSSMTEQNKFKLCILPTQMGKTFVTINKILDEIATISEGRSVHFVLTMNTLLNNKQFANRLSDIKEEHGENAVAIFASTYKGDLTHIDKSLQAYQFFQGSVQNAQNRCCMQQLQAF